MKKNYTATPEPFLPYKLTYTAMHAPSPSSTIRDFLASTEELDSVIVDCTDVGVPPVLQPFYCNEKLVRKVCSLNIFFLIEMDMRLISFTENQLLQFMINLNKNEFF